MEYIGAESKLSYGCSIVVEAVETDCKDIFVVVLYLTKDYFLKIANKINEY